MKKNSSLLCLLLALGLTRNLTAQNNVGIGTPTPDPTAVLHLSSTTQGLLVPTMSSTQRTAIVNPADGLLVYDNTVECFYFYSATSAGWISLCQGGGGGGGATGPAGPAGPTGATGATGTGGGTGGSGGVTGPTGPTGLGGYNSAFTFNPTTDSLSITDGGGTLTTNIAPGRWASRGTTDISSSSTTFVAMPGTALTFTPNKSVVYVMASLAGDADGTHQSECVLEARVRNTTNNTTVIASQTLANASSINSTTLQIAIGIAWNMSMVTAYNVTPGVPVTIQLEWAVQWADGLPGPAYNNVVTEPDASNRSIVVFE